MNIKQTFLSTTTVVLCAMIIFPFAAHAEEGAIATPFNFGTPPPATPQVLGTSTSASLATPTVPPMVAKIKEAKEALKPVKSNYQLIPVYTKNKKTGKSVLSSYKLGLRDLLVAVLDPATGTISITGAMQNNKTFTFPDKSFDIKQIGFNGVNTRFQVNTPAGGQVIALKYLITPVESGSKAAIENALYEAIYVPYSPFLDTPEVQEYGAKYLDNVINEVAVHLANYPSVSDPGKTITQAINPSLVKALVYAEHTDSNELLKAPDTMNVVNRVKTLFGGNEGDTYRYSGSSAGALGISQFIQSTYLGLVKRHPNANLIPDFRQGMADHVNAIKSTYILLDDYIQGVKDRAQDSFIPGQAFDFGVAAYNGGTVRVARALNSFGLNWNSDQAIQMRNAKQADVSSLAAQVETLRKATLAQKDKTRRAQMQAELDAMRVTLKSDQAELARLQDATLRDETRGYLQKIYKVITLFNEQLHTASTIQ